MAADASDLKDVFASTRVRVMFRGLRPVAIATIQTPRAMNAATNTIATTRASSAALIPTLPALPAVQLSDRWTSEM